MDRFPPGTHVALREILRGSLWAARPAIVVLDEPDRQMFYVPIGAQWVGPDVRDRRELIRTKSLGVSWSLRERPWLDSHVLSFAWTGARHAVLHFWDEGWAATSWYVNVQRPLRRSPPGFDTLDEDLDVLIAPDRSSWSWKDEEDVALGVELGLYTPGEVDELRREGARGRDRVLLREPPFDREWADWRPDAEWALATLPTGWDDLGG